MITYFAGVDIGGTKCRVSLGKKTEDGLELAARGESRATPGQNPQKMLELLAGDIKQILPREERTAALGISCGSPLDQKQGLILSPPNLPLWDRIPVTEYFSRELGIPAFLENDADAGALAEWKYGAGRGCGNLVFLTCGTGMGAGLILNERLYSGAGGQAGEVGHIRLSEDGPPGYGKRGSFEGFCSGGGITRLARSMVEAELQMGRRPAFCPSYAGLDSLSARTVGIAAEQGDPLAKKIYAEAGKKLGAGLSIIMDILNPELIIIGSIFARSRGELWPSALAVIEEEALPAARERCRVLPGELGEETGDYAALAAAEYGLEGERVSGNQPQEQVRLG
ncbi:MAG: ROK family protein [Treponema sp.]|jgi:glucokinase|nr:ROK family protein [Treponema sp.]